MKKLLLLIIIIFLGLCVDQDKVVQSTKKSVITNIVTDNQIVKNNNSPNLIKSNFYSDIYVWKVILTFILVIFVIISIVFWYLFSIFIRYIAD